MAAQVFGVYGIGVDQRHLGLIGDYMMHQARAPGSRASGPTVSFHVRNLHAVLVSAALPATHPTPRWGFQSLRKIRTSTGLHPAVGLPPPAHGLS